MRALRRWIKRFGVPRALYLDRKSVYLAFRPPTPEEQLAGKEPRTVFGEACDKLGVELITAHSPQAKGRVERNHGVYRDRFVRELRHRRITGIREADALLEGGFCNALNDKFAKAPKDKKDDHRPLPRGLDLRDVFCIDETRTLGNDWCIRHDNHYYQISAPNAPLPKPKAKITVRQWLDGNLFLLYNGQRLAYASLDTAPPEAPKRKRPKREPATKARQRPSDTHSWRRRRLPIHTR